MELFFDIEENGSESYKTLGFSHKYQNLSNSGNYFEHQQYL